MPMVIASSTPDPLDTPLSVIEVVLKTVFLNGHPVDGSNVSPTPTKSARATPDNTIKAVVANKSRFIVYLS